MDKIFVGLVVGASFLILLAILKSNAFNQWQKIVLGILIIFPPAQWVLAIIFYLSNNYVENNPKIKSNVNKFINDFQPPKKEENNFNNQSDNRNKPSGNKEFNGNNPYSKN